MLLTSRLEIAFRGHDKSKRSLNRGNILEIFSLIAKYDPIVQEYIDKGPKNATYHSPNIQSSILQIIGKMIRGSICDQVRQAGFSC